ncbi:hypothetical protein CR194_15985 [Salipaludibacillus keqinensis]|uniref:Sensor domain-containing diguanylate cyclase n=1 Tax=Salipaludibacillus keqinensis TaxID=2045207 RepID=A0A323T9G2_9BACI|nr:GGDEF domain-containing protein [Salipaludibacillus keqinensis]PYZ92332.1 hypothetical protein CR194_15985 [Salipaludibacillus keqinensis]
MINKIDTSVLFEQAFRFSSIGIALVSLKGKFVVTNPMLTNMLGYSELELKNKTFRDLTYSADLEDSVLKVDELIEGEVSYYQVEKRYIHKEGKIIWCLLNVSVVKDDEGTPLYFISQFQDITERKSYERQLNESQERLTKILETVPNGVTIIDLQGNITFANEMAEEILGLKKEDIVSRQYDTPDWKIKTVDGAAIPSEDLPFGRVVQTQQIVRDYVHVIESGSGDRKILSINASPLYDHKGRFISVLNSIVDITNKKNTEQELMEANKLLKKLAERDGLTGVANRRYFDDQLDTIWDRCNVDNTSLSLIMLDIDCFKKYNDYYGHQAGDDCLKKVTEVIDKKLEGLNTVFARYGGEEFAVILIGFCDNKAYLLAEELQKAVEGLKIPHATSTISDYVTISSGIGSMSPHQKNNRAELVKQADQALYLAKEKGRNRVAKFI